MASLYQRKDSVYWWMQWYEGKQKHYVSTGIRHNNSPKPSKSGALWEILCQKEAELARRRFGLAEAINDASIEQWTHDYIVFLQTTRKGHSRSTWDRYRATINNFLRWCKTEKLHNLSQVTYTAAADFVAHRSTLCGSKTLHCDTTLLGAIWDEAARRNLVTFKFNPWRRLRPTEIKSKSRRALTLEEITYLFAQLPSLPLWQQYAFTTALYTGARLTSIILLPRKQVQSDLISFPDEIVKEHPYTVPLHSTLKTFLKKYRGGDASHFVEAPIRKRHQDKEYCTRKLNDQIKRWSTKSGHFQAATFHCLRHTFISRLQQCGVEKSDVQMLAGHATAAMTEIYTHIDAKALAPAMAKLSWDNVTKS